MESIDFAKYEELTKKSYIKHLGRVTKIVGLTIESLGPNVNMGEVCRIISEDTSLFAEVVGFRDNRILLMPLGELTGIGLGSVVEALGHALQVSVSDGLLGRIVDGLGKPIDNNEPFYTKEL
ncbi:MAG: EscN/YscN/HrcN family type III secretion system ATPase, partial [Vallitaleaceae bacterium]|nr:EscN/YscN/HrcN family type III secretion system ATPase [Vallitaleaceae bacterium]